MEIEPTPIAGATLLRPTVHGDARGFFLETWHADRYGEAGIDQPFVQDNHSRSSRGILRGLHFQTTQPQGKLVRVTSGEVFDVIVDCRADSASCGQWYGVTLTAENHEQLWVPPGFAHGFTALNENTELEYKCTAYYDPEDEGSILWSDPDLNIPWPVAQPILSAKDMDAQLLKDLQL